MLNRTVPRRRVAPAFVVALAAAGMAASSAAPASAASTPKCFGKRPTLVLRAKGAAVTLSSKAKSPVIVMLGKSDSLNASKVRSPVLVCDLGGAKQILTGAGNDKVTFKNGNPTISSGKGNDTVTQTGIGNPVIHLGDGNDVAVLGKGNGTVYGEAGADVLTAGRSGHQTLIGGAGNDTLVAGAAIATLDGTDGGNHYVVPSAYTANTTTILHAGDTVNGVVPPVKGTTPPVVPPVTPPVVPPAAALPVGTIQAVSFGDGSTSTPNYVNDVNGTGFMITGAPGNGGTVASWSLDTGDGAPVHTGQGQPPAELDHRYRTSGVRTATLVLTDGLNRAVTSTATVDVAGAASATFAATIANGSTAEVGTFTGGAGNRAKLVMSTVDFGDGSAPVVTSGAPGSLNHTYALAAFYDISVSVADDHGGFDYESNRVVVRDASVHARLSLGNVVSYASAPTARDTVDGAGDPVGFSLDACGSAYDTADTNFDSWVLNPGNGSANYDLFANCDPYYTYPAAGTYHPTVTVTRGAMTSTVTGTIYIGTKTTVTLTGVISVPQGQSAEFDVNASPGTAPSGGPANTITHVSVSYGAEATSDSPSGGAFTHAFTTPGPEDVCADVSDTYQSYPHELCTTTLVTTASPYAWLTFDYGTPSPWYGIEANGSSPTDVYLSGFGSTGVVSGATYRLDFGDGTPAATGTFDLDANPVPAGQTDSLDSLSHTYAPGEYTASLVVTDKAGKTTTLARHVSAALKPSATIGAPTVGTGTIAIPVSSFSAGTGAVADYYTVDVYASTSTDSNPLVTETSGLGAPPSSITMPTTGPGPYTVHLYLRNDHDGFAALSSTSS